MNKSVLLPPLFGVNVHLAAGDAQEPFCQARIADENGLDLITLNDQPHSSDLFDAWTLLTTLAMKTRHIHLGTNVLCAPLRPPAIVAKMVATLDVLTAGRMELGLGAGRVMQAIAAFGGTAFIQEDMFAALEDSIRIIQGLWDNVDGSFTYAGRIYQVHGTQLGPAPAHRIPIWVDAICTRAQRLAGQLADGVLVSTASLPPECLAEANRLIDAAAEQAGRSPSDVRRGYNLMGVLDLGRPDTKLDAPWPDLIIGTVRHWVETMVHFYCDYRQDTFIFWPVAGNTRLQIEAFAQEVVPAARDAIEAARHEGVAWANYGHPPEHHAQPVHGLQRSESSCDGQADHRARLIASREK